MDTAQVLLLSVVVILTTLLLVLGVQVFFILKELRRTIMKVNNVLDDASAVVESVSAPFANFSTIISGLKTGLSLAKIFHGKKKGKHKEDSEDGE